MRKRVEKNMSLFKFTWAEIGEICNSVLSHKELWDRAGIPWKEKANFALLGFDGMSWDQEKNNFLYFMDRVWVANQVAVDFAYNAKSFEIQRLATEHIKGFLNEKNLLKKLKSLRYNLITNAGRSFISQEDSERLDTLISVLSHLMLEDYQRKEEGFPY